MNKLSRCYKQTTFSGQKQRQDKGIMFVIQSGVNNKLQKKVKGIYFVIYGIISEFTDKGQFQYLTN